MFKEKLATRLEQEVLSNIQKEKRRRKYYRDHVVKIITAKSDQINFMCVSRGMWRRIEAIQNRQTTGTRSFKPVLHGLLYTQTESPSNFLGIRGVQVHGFSQLRSEKLGLSVFDSVIYKLSNVYLEKKVFVETKGYTDTVKITLTENNIEKIREDFNKKSVCMLLNKRNIVSIALEGVLEGDVREVSRLPESKIPARGSEEDRTWA